MIYGSVSKFPPEEGRVWPSLVAVSDEAVYVGEVVNRRVMQLQFAYGDQLTCKVR